MTTTAVHEKAVRLLASGAVQPTGPAETFTVEGDTGTYTVVVGDQVALCTCAARSRCSHIVAAVARADARDEQRALMDAALDARRARESGLRVVA